MVVDPESRKIVLSGRSSSLALRAMTALLSTLVFGIAGKGEEHLEVLANICRILEDEAVLERMKTTDDVDWVQSVLTGAH